jgi:DNA polymerase III subunit delta'
MSSELIEPDRLPHAAHPRAMARLYGHAAQEQALLDALRSGRMHHAWLLTGDEGIGKASFAYRVARFMLAHADPEQAAQSATSLDVSLEHPVARKILAQSHPDLHLLRRVIRPDGKTISANIPVDNVRRIIDLFGTSAAAGGWRICIVDSTVDLDRAGANALLKLLEEPPKRCLFLIVAPALGQVLPTIRSRCRKLALAPLSVPDVVAAGAAALAGVGTPYDRAALTAAASLSQGSVRRALNAVDPETIALIQAVTARLDGLPELDPASILALAEDMAGKAGADDFAVMVDTVQAWLGRQVAARAGERPARLAPLAQVWETLGTAVREAASYNLDRRPLVITLFRDLAEAVKQSRAA